MQLDRILLIIQVALYYGCVGIRFADDVTYVLSYIMIGLIGSSTLIKLFRSLKALGLKMLVEMQVLFFTLYIMTAVEVAFYYQVIKITMSEGNQAVAIAIVLCYSFNYSLFASKKTMSNIQFIIYTVGMIVDFSLNLWANMRAVDYFAEFKDQTTGLMKSYMMLATAILTAKSVMIMNKLQLVWEKTRQMRKQEQANKKSLEVKLHQLNDTERTQ